MRAIIHIGCVKTGSSSVQGFLQDNRALLGEQGVLYPQTPLQPPLAWAPRTHHIALARHLALGRPQGDFLNPLRRELAAAGCRAFILSEELFSELMRTPAQLQRLHDFLQALGCDEVRVVVWLRECGAMFASLCSQQLKNGRPEWFHLMPPAALPHFRFLMDYRALLTRWAGIFGREALEVRLFERECWPQGELLRDAAAAFGLRWDERFVLPPHLNESFNLLEMEVLRVVNHLLPGSEREETQPTAPLRDLMRRHVSVLDDPALRFAPPAAVTRAWREWAAEGNEWVRAQFFPARPALFAARGGQTGNPALPALPAEGWEALGRVLAQLSEENRSLRRQLQRRAAARGEPPRAAGISDPPAR